MDTNTKPHRALAPIAFSCALILGSTSLYANEYSPTLQGVIGLNSYPSARMDKTGTVRAGTATLDPYLHSFAGLQLSKNLYINARQSAEISSITRDATNLYPGLDLKFKLLNETATSPALAIGLQSAFGHKQTAGEYIALSKRYKNLDFTLGAGWGRYAGSSSIRNPLKTLSSHFGKSRTISGDEANKPIDWFTGETIGFFAGLEYFTPIKGLSLKADWGTNQYEVEHAAFNYDSPAPWSLSANYKPTDWADFNLGIQGTDKIMARLSLSTNPNTWNWAEKTYNPASPMRERTAQNTSITAIKAEATQGNFIINSIQSENNITQAQLALHPYYNTPFQMGRAARAIANNSAPNIQAIAFTPTIHNLKGPTIRLMRSDLENALIYNNGSPEEIWQNATFTTEKQSNQQTTKNSNNQRFFHNLIPELTLETQFSVNEEDQGTLYRTALIAGTKKTEFFGLLTSASSLRLNIADNLDQLNNTRLQPLLPTRSNIQDFTDTAIAIETLYTSYTHSFNSSTHMALTQGFIEEMYAALGGEILYRPYNARWAIGAEGWVASKRDPLSSLHMGLTGDSVLTGHINAWYDLPEDGLTLHAKIGRYLAEDYGATLSLDKTFRNGTKLESFVTLTDQADTDVFGGTTHAYGGLSLTIPLGNIPYIPQGSKAKIITAPFGRNTGQSLNNPMALYELTQPFSYDHITQNWSDIIK